MKLHFAVAGVPHSTPKPGGTVNGLRHAHSLGITAMELEWVQRVPLNEERMAEIRTISEELGMYLTCHAPYYINLNSSEPATLAASTKRILDALQMAEIAGIRSVCVHAAFYQRSTPEETYNNVRRAVDAIIAKKAKLFPSVNLGLETMGKVAQFGTLDEVLRISKEFGVYPVLDPAHMHARTNGAVNSAAEWEEMLDAYVTYLGDSALQEMHMHYSGIAYGPRGEKHHLPLRESDANWKDFLVVLKKRGVGGTVVCESPLLEEDTLLMQKKYTEL